MRAVIAAVLMSVSLPCSADALKPFQRGSWQALLHDHAGRSLIVHFWGVTCGPCLAELPQWSVLLDQKPRADVAIISADPVPMKRDMVEARLTKSGLSGADTWMFEGFADRLRYEVDPNWQGELPRTLLIAADGSVKVIEGAADFDAVRRWIDAQPPVK